MQMAMLRDTIIYGLFFVCFNRHNRWEKMEKTCIIYSKWSHIEKHTEVNRSSSFCCIAWARFTFRMDGQVGTSIIRISPLSGDQKWIPKLISTVYSPLLSRYFTLSGHNPIVPRGPDKRGGTVQRSAKPAYDLSPQNQNYPVLYIENDHAPGSTWLTFLILPWGHSPINTSIGPSQFKGSPHQVATKYLVVKVPLLKWVFFICLVFFGWNKHYPSLAIAPVYLYFLP